MRRIAQVLLAVFVLLGVVMPGSAAVGAEAPALSILFDKGTYRPGETAVVTIGINNVPVGVLESATVELHYDAAVFDAPLTSSADEPGMRSGSVLPNATFVTQHFPGAVSISMSDPGLAVAGTKLLTLRFPIKAYVPDGTGHINFAPVTSFTQNGVLFLDGAATPNTIAEGTHSDGSAKIFLGGTLSGRVKLANRMDQNYGGITVSVPSLGRSAVTDASGTFTIGDLPEGIHEVTFSRSGYLSAMLTGAVIVRGGLFDVTGQNIQLIPGNIRDTAVGPDVVFLEDLAGLARAIGSNSTGTTSFGGVWDPLADLDASGDVGASDLGILAGNWALRGPANTAGSASPGTIYNVPVPALTPTVLTLTPSLSTVQYSDRVVLTAVLSTTGTTAHSLVHKQIQFQVGSHTFWGSTNADGTATVHAYVDMAAGGPYTLSASFPGDPVLAASSGSTEISVSRESAALHYLGPDLIDGGLTPIEVGLSQEDDGSWAHLGGLQVKVTVTPDGEAALTPVVVNVDPYTAKASAAFTLPHKSASVAVELVANNYFTASSLTKTVQRSNIAPQAAADSYTAVAGKVLTVATGTGVLVNDFDGDGDALKADLVSGVAPADGTVVLNQDGSFTFTPASGFVGTASFTYRVYDGMATSESAVVTIEVLNHPPAALDDWYVATSNYTLSVATSTGVLANDSDADGHPLTVIPLSLPSTGSFTLQADGSFSYTPPVGFVGWVSFQYAVNDGFETSGTATGSIEVVNQPPVGATDTFSISEDTPLTVWAGALLSNDSDPDGHTPLKVMIWSYPAHGTLVASGTDSWVYTPALNITGPDSFQYVVSDGMDESAPVTVKIGISAVNDAPALVVNQSFRLVDEDGGVHLDGWVNDPDDSATTVRIDAVNGTLDLVLAGSATIAAGATGTDSITLSGPLMDVNNTIYSSVRFMPSADYNGSATVTWTVQDAAGLTDTFTVSISVNPVNDPPTAMPDSFTVPEDGSITVDVLSNDSTLPDSGESLTIDFVSAPDKGGAVTWTGTLITYTPAPNFNGTETFAYTVTDGFHYTTATVTMTVTAVNDAPALVVAPDYLAVDEDSQVKSSGWVNDPDDSSMTVRVDATNGTLDVTPLSGVSIVGGATGTGSITLSGPLASLNDTIYSYLFFKPNPNYNGSATLTWTAQDTAGLTDTFTVTIAVNPVNDPPTAMPDSFTVAEDGSITVDVLSNDSTLPDSGETLTIVDGGLPDKGGTVTWTGTLITYTPAPNFNGTESFTYTVTDGFHYTTATVTMTVTAVNDAPTVAEPEFRFTDEDVAHAFDAIVGDVDDASLTVQLDSVNGTLDLMPSGGVTITDGATGSFSLTLSGPVSDLNATLSYILFLPQPDSTATGTVTITVKDAANLAATGTTTISVNPVNDPPTAMPDSFTVAEDGSITVDVLSNDSTLPDSGETLTIVDGGLPDKGGTVTLSGAPIMITYAPAPNFHGTETFTYTVTDGFHYATATVTMTVTAVNDAPTVAAPEFRFTDEDVAHAFDAIVGDVDDANLTVQLDSVNGTLDLVPSGGVTITGGATGSFSLTLSGPVSDLNATLSYILFLPQPDSTATGTVTILVKDAANLAATGTTTITVNPVNDPPVVTWEDHYETGVNMQLIVNAAYGVLANDYDPEGATLTATLVEQPASGSGTVVLNADGSFTYTPPADTVLAASFGYTVSDGVTTSGTVYANIYIRETSDFANLDVTIDPSGQLRVHANLVDNWGNQINSEPVKITVESNYQNSGNWLTEPVSTTYTTQDVDGTLNILWLSPATYNTADYDFRVSLENAPTATRFGALVQTTAIELTGWPPTYVDEITAAVNDVATLTATLSTPVSGLQVNFTVGGTFVGSAYTDASGTASLGYSVGATTGSFEIRAEFAGTARYLASSGTATLTVSPSVALSLSFPLGSTDRWDLPLPADVTLTSGGSPVQGATVTFSLHDSASQAVDQFTGQTDINGFVSWPIHLPTYRAGTFTMTAAFAGDGTVDPASATGTLTYTAAPTYFSAFYVNGSGVGPVAGYAGEAISISSHLLTTAETDIGDAVQIRYEVKDSGRTVIDAFYATTATSGAASTTFTFPTIGTYYIAPAFDGNNNLGAATGTEVQVDVATDTALIVDSISAVSGDTVTLKAAISPAVSGLTINFTVGGVAAGSATTDASGTASLAYSVTQASGTFTIGADFAGTAHYLASAGSGSLTVQAPTTLTLTFPYGSTGSDWTNWYQAQVELKSGTTLIPNATITYTLTDSAQQVVEQYIHFTDATGLAFFYPDPLRAGDFTVKVAFEGDGTYGPASGSGTVTYTAAPTDFSYFTINNASGSVSALVNSPLSIETRLVAGIEYWIEDSVQLRFEVRDGNSALIDTFYTTTHSSGDGTATATYTLGTVGSYTITPVFDGNTNLLSSTGTAFSVTVQAETALTVGSVSGLLGDSVNLEATISPATQGLTINFSVGGVAAGSATTDASGTASLAYALSLNPGSYTILADFAGSTYYLASTGSATLTVLNSAPTATDDSYPTDEDLSLTVAASGVLSNDSDLEGNALTAVLGSGPANGTLTLNADGSFTYTPNANFNGTDSFTYVANDGALNSATATVTITVNAVNDAPVAADDSYSATQDTTLTVAAPGVLTNDSDVDGNPLTAAVVTGPVNGTLTLNADGSFTYSPNSGYSGSDSFTYVANDGALNSATATVTITVNALSGPVGHWKLDEGTGTSAADSSGNNKTGTLAGTYTWSASDVAPNIGSTASLFVNGGSVDVTGGIDLYNQSFTIAFWAKRTTTGTGDFYVISQGTGADNQGLHIGFRNDQFQFAFWNNDLQTTSTYADTANWHHWAVTFDAGTLVQRLYLNGTEIANRTSTSTLLSSGTFVIGKRFDGAGAFQGGVDDVRVYQRVLSQTEIQGLMTQ